MSRKLFTAALLIPIILLFGCKNDNNIIIGKDPVVNKIITAEYWNIKDSSQYSIEAHIEDPQGYDNIKTVTLTVTDDNGGLILKNALYDDGAFIHPNSGDKMANDGIYANTFKAADIARQPATFTFTVSAEDDDGNTADPLEKSIIFDYASKPILYNISVPETLKNSFETQYFYVTVYDSAGVGNINKVWFQIEDIDIEGVLKTYDMYNDGTNGDAAANDSIYTYKADSSFSIGRTGDFKLTFFAKNLFNQKSDAVIHNIYYAPEKPIITKIDMPDSLKRPSGLETIAKLIQVWVTDGQGQADIDSVYFYSRKPDGELANNGNSIPLKDDGQNGDEIAGDGIYSFLMYMSSAAYIGTYEFYFYARDKSGNLSDSVKKTLEVY